MEWLYRTIHQSRIYEKAVDLVYLDWRQFRILNGKARIFVDKKNGVIEYSKWVATLKENGSRSFLISYFLFTITNSNLLTKLYD